MRPLRLVSLFRCGPIAIRQIQSLLATMYMTLQVPSYTQLCLRQTKVVAFSATVPSENRIVEALHIVIYTTGLKV
jgi:hypothetical protein